MTNQERADRIVELLQEAANEGSPMVGHFEILNVNGQVSRNWSIHWNEEVDDLFSIPPHEVAEVLGVLGHESRLAILRELMSGPKTVVQLVESLGLKTTGQAYHHLKELQRARYVCGKQGDKFALDMKYGRLYVAALALAKNAAGTPGGER